MVVASSAVFALGHGMQGRDGVVVTGLYGVALAGEFLVTGRLVVFVAVAKPLFTVVAAPSVTCSRSSA